MEPAESLEEWYLVPEAVLGFYNENLETLKAAVELARKLKELGIRGFEEPEKLEKLIRKLNESGDCEAEAAESTGRATGRCLERSRVLGQ